MTNKEHSPFLLLWLEERHKSSLGDLALSGPPGAGVHHRPSMSPCLSRAVGLQPVLVAVAQAAGVLAAEWRCGGNGTEASGLLEHASL